MRIASSRVVQSWMSLLFIINDSSQSTIPIGFSLAGHQSKPINQVSQPINQNSQPINQNLQPTDRDLKIKESH